MTRIDISQWARSLRYIDRGALVIALFTLVFTISLALLLPPPPPSLMLPVMLLFALAGHRHRRRDCVAVYRWIEGNCRSVAVRVHRFDCSRSVEQRTKPLEPPYPHPPRLLCYQVGDPDPEARRATARRARSMTSSQLAGRA